MIMEAIIIRAPIPKKENAIIREDITPSLSPIINLEFLQGSITIRVTPYQINYAPHTTPGTNIFFINLCNTKNNTINPKILISPSYKNKG